MKKRICLWSSPRNISTALMYSFAQRKDTRVIDEPLYGHYLRVTGADHPGKDEVMASMECDGEKVVNNVIFGDYEEEVIFMKQMTHHLVGLDESFLERVTNVFLIRDPNLLIASFAKVIAQPTMIDIGIKKQFELFKKLKETGQKNAVIDSGNILNNPKESLSKFCEFLGIGFEEAMLSWKAGPRKEDGIWAKYWYGNVHKSTGFEQSEREAVKLPPELNQLAEESMNYYALMKQETI